MVRVRSRVVVALGVVFASLWAGFIPPERAWARPPAPTIIDDQDLGPAVAALTRGGWPKVYIVTYQPGVDVDAATTKLKSLHNVGELYRYHHALRGAALIVGSAQQAARVAADYRVAAMVPDQLVQACGEVVVAEKDEESMGTITAEPQPPQTIPLGIIRVGALETDNEAEGVVVAVLDSGIDATHPDLAGNIHTELHKDCVGNNPLKDNHGHGTHIAGTIAAVDNSIGVLGVANQINLVSVRVVNNQATGTWAQLICGVDWVTGHADRIKVANMSLSGPLQEGEAPLHEAIQRSVAAGVTYAVAAGNDGGPAENNVPASYDEVITVSAYWTDESGDVGFPTFSNYGPDVDIAAPGVFVYSTWRRNGYAFQSGTSMATAHVSAAAAMYISRHPNARPDQVRDALISHGEQGYAGQESINPETGLPYDPEPLLDVRGF